MRKNDFPTADPALREALRQIQTDIDLMPLSEDMEEQVMKRIASAPARPIHTNRWSRFRRVAAVIALAVALGGVVYAAIRWTHPTVSTPSVCCDSVATTPITHSDDGTVLFENVRLDSVMQVVATQYGRTVCFADEAPQQLRFSVSWRMNQPLSAFVETMNEFDGLRLTDRNDTLFVESVDEEEGEE